jgi:hypothetical protein
VLQSLGAMGYVVPVRVMVELPQGKSVTEAVYLRGLKHLSDSLRADPRVSDIVSIVDLSEGNSILKYSLCTATSTRHAKYRVLGRASARRRVAMIDVFPAGLRRHNRNGHQ